jgi:hypothetical protein
MKPPEKTAPPWHDPITKVTNQLDTAFSELLKTAHEVHGANAEQFAGWYVVMSVVGTYATRGLSADDLADALATAVYPAWLLGPEKGRAMFQRAAAIAADWEV